MRRAFSLALILALSGCGLFGSGDGEGVTADALPFRTDLSRGEEDKREVAVRVEAGGASVDAVRESVRFPVTRYCLSTYGRSEAAWSLDPVSGDWAFRRDGSDMIFTARCVAR